MFAYCGNNPVNGSDPLGDCFHQAPYDKYYNFFCSTCAQMKQGTNMGTWSSGIQISDTSVVTTKLPTTGAEPNSKGTEYNPDGTPKRHRWYDSEGNAERDRDFNHPGKWPFPHDHEWKDGKRGKDHLDPSPDYKRVFNNDNWQKAGAFVFGTALLAGGIYMFIMTGDTTAMDEAIRCFP